MIGWMKAGLVAATALGAAGMNAGTAAAQERAMIVLDGSGSMWGQIDGKAKIEIARQTLGDVLGAVPEGNELGLMVYGHRRKGDCNDIELAVPAGKGTGGAIATFANGISPKGKTPLSAAVKKAAEALKYTEDAATVILVTDGLETCEMDPCALGRELEAAGVNFTAHVVGFGLSKEEGAQVACLAEETGGQYLEASSAEALGAALEQTVVSEAAPEPEPEPEPEPAKPEFNLRATASLAEGGPMFDEPNIRWELRAVDAAGKVEKKTVEADYDATFRASVPAGDYELRTRVGRIDLSQAVTLSETEETALTVVLDAGIVEAVARRIPGGEMEKTIRIDVASGKAKDGAYGEGRFIMPAGTLTVMGRLGKAKTTQEVALAAGESIALEVIVGSGVVMASALYAEGGPDVEVGDIRYTVYEVKTDLKGRRKQLTGVYGSKPMDIPVGEWVLGAKLDQAEVFSEPFTVEAGARTDVQVVLNAGVAAITAPGGDRIRIMGKKNIEGNRKEIVGKYGEEFTVTLPAGTYLARVTFKGDVAPKEAELVVSAGERTELTLE